MSTPTHCAVCSAVLTHPPTGRRRRFCSRACMFEQRRRDWNVQRGESTRTCEVCSSSIEGRRRDVRFCSQKCAYRSKAERRGTSPIPSAEDRFWSRVNRSSREGCWVWTGARLVSGYGSLRVNNRAVVVHRFAWELLRGPIPDGLQVDHLCRNRACCNPDHLEPVTQAENLRRARDAASLTPLTGERP